MTELDLEAIDRDGALREALTDAEGLTRSGAFRAALAGFGGAALLAGFKPGSAFAATTRPTRARDVKILNFALQLERLGVAFYSDAIAKGALKDEPLVFATATRADEIAHVAFVQAAIRGYGGKVAPSAKFDFGSVTSNQTTFLSASERMEQLCVEALNGAGPLVTKTTLAGAGQLVSVEARQVAWVRLIRGSSNPVGGPFDTARSAASVRQKALATGFIKSSLPLPK